MRQRDLTLPKSASTSLDLNRAFVATTLLHPRHPAWLSPTQAHTAMDHNYWNVDDFLADSQKLPCTFNVDVPNMGQIQSNGERDVKALSRVELPFWLAELMALK